MVKSRHIAESQREESPACQELLSICAMLNIPEPRGLDTAGAFSQVQDRVSVEKLTWSKRQAVVIVPSEEYLSVNTRH